MAANFLLFLCLILVLIRMRNERSYLVFAAIGAFLGLVLGYLAVYMPSAVNAISLGGWYEPQEARRRILVLSHVTILGSYVGISWAWLRESTGSGIGTHARWGVLFASFFVICGVLFSQRQEITSFDDGVRFAMVCEMIAFVFSFMMVSCASWFQSLSESLVARGVRFRGVLANAVAWLLIFLGLIGGIFVAGMPPYIQ